MESNNFILSIIRFYNEKIKQHMRALSLNSVKSMKARILQTNFMKTVVYRVIKIPHNHGLRIVPYILPYKLENWERKCVSKDLQEQTSLKVINFLPYSPRYVENRQPGNA